MVSPIDVPKIIFKSHNSNDEIVFLITLTSWKRVIKTNNEQDAYLFSSKEELIQNIRHIISIYDWDNRKFSYDLFHGECFADIDDDFYDLIEEYYNRA